MFRFGEPTYLYLLLLLPFLAAFYLYSNYKRRKNIRRFGDPTLLAQLMPDVSKYRPDVKFWIIFVAIGLFSVLLARSVCQVIERKEVLKNYFSSPISSFEKSDGKLTHKESKKFLQSVLKIINDNITNKDLTPRYIADRLAISPRSLYRKMEEIGEDSPTDLIKECRLHIAKDLLLTTKKTIDEIVFDSGFSNKVTFFKVFREKYECTPKEFRMKHLEEVQQ